MTQNSKAIPFDIPQNVEEAEQLIQDWAQKFPKDYWADAQPDENGVIGGRGSRTFIDVQFSRLFFQDLLEQNPQLQTRSVVDAAGGMGRVSKHLLVNIFDEVDIFDICETLIQKAKVYLKDEKKVRNFYVSPSQEFEYKEKYDCIFGQWALTSLTDEKLIKFLERSKAALNEGGMMIFKQNIYYKNVVFYDPPVIVRRDQEYKQIFKKAGLKIIKSKIQQFKDDPNQYNLGMYALK